LIGGYRLRDRLREISSAASRHRTLVLGLMLFLGLTAGFTLFQAPEDRSSDQEFNRQDVMFMNMMIVHHDQAIEMAELAENRTDNEEILELSRNISQAQRAENEQMTEWMQELGYETGNHHPMAGMASQEEMRRLETSEGENFDKLFAELMIEHHRGGIEMARNFREVGLNSELKAMQTQMIEAQQSEIKKMERWQKQGF
jgi:uncharacterized protein (DUF305 family)